MTPSSASPTGRLAGRLSLITGASRGIGAAVAKRFAAEGAQLILLGRSQGGLEELDDAIRGAGGARPTLVPLDLGKLDDIDRMVTGVAERFGRLDVLVGNAAMLGTLGPLSHADPAMMERAFRINVLANYRLIRAAEPLLRLSPAGRSIFVTSRITRTLRPFHAPYASSKAALEAMIEVYAGEIAHTSMRVNLVDPGIVRTRMRAEAFPGEDPLTLPPPEAATEVFVELAEASCQRNGEIVHAQPALAHSGRMA